MSINHDIRNLLDIQDSNIHFVTNCVNQRLYNGRMAFEYINAKTGTILGILPSRLSRDIKDHFMSRYSYAQRCAVEIITIDMNAGYEKLIKKLFPKAKIIIDRFHLVQLINRSKNKLRISVINDFRTSNSVDQKNYRRLKKYWKLPVIRPNF